MNFKSSIFSLVLAFGCTSLTWASDPVFDVVIVGGGLAGLNAARTIHQADPKINLLVVEGRERLGGRTYTIDCDGIKVEAGGELIDPDDYFIRTTLDTLKIEVDPVRLNGNVFGIDQDVKIPLAELTPYVGSLYQKLKQTLGTLKNEDYSKLNAENSTCIDTDLASRLNLDPREKQLLQCIIRDECGIDYDQAPLSLIHYLVERVGAYKIIGSAKSIPVVSFFANKLLSYVAYQFRIQGGTQSLVQELASKIPAQSIMLGACLTHLAVKDNQYILQLQDGRSFNSKKVIMATPFSVLRSEFRILDDSLNISPALRELIDTMPYGTNSKLIVPVKGCPATSYVLNLNYNGITAWQNPAGITWMMGGSAGAVLTAESPCVGEIKRQMPQLFAIKSQDVGQPIVINWSQDRFSRGSYSALTKGTPYSNLSAPSDILPGLCKFASARNNTLFFIGEHACDGVTECAENNGKPISTGHMQSALYSGYIVGKFITQK